MNELKEFTEKIMRISAPAIPAFGTGLPGVAGAPAAEQGAMTPAAQTLFDLKNKVAIFERAMSKDAKDLNQISQLSKDIEGNIQGLQTLSVIDDWQADSLIDQLQNIVRDAK